MGVRMARRGAWVAVAGLLLGVIGCGDGDGTAIVTPPDDNTPAVATRTVTGFVGDSTSGFGITGAQVVIGQQVVTTNANGLFSLRDVPRQDLTVTVSATGYQSVTFTLSNSVDSFNRRLIPTGNFGTVEPPPGSPGI